MASAKMFPGASGVHAGSGCSVLTYYRVDYSGTVDVISPSYLMNSGTVRVGANSTGVEITGTGGNEQGFPQLFNAGTIDASQDGSSTAIRLNADNEPRFLRRQRGHDCRQHHLRRRQRQAHQHADDRQRRAHHALRQHRDERLDDRLRRRQQYLRERPRHHHDHRR